MPATPSGPAEAMTPFGTGQHKPEPGPPQAGLLAWAPPRLSIAGLSKTFGSAQVLRQVCPWRSPRVE